MSEIQKQNEDLSLNQTPENLEQESFLDKTQIELDVTKEQVNDYLKTHPSVSQAHENIMDAL